MGVMGWVYGLIFSTLLRGDMEDLAAAEALCLAQRPSSGVACVVVRASDLKDTPGTGMYSVVPAESNVGPRVAREDVATFMLSLLATHEFDGKAISIGCSSGRQEWTKDAPTRQTSASEDPKAAAACARVLELEREVAELNAHLTEAKASHSNGFGVAGSGPTIATAGLLTGAGGRCDDDGAGLGLTDQIAISDSSPGSDATDDAEHGQRECAEGKCSPSIAATHVQRTAASESEDAADTGDSQALPVLLQIAGTEGDAPSTARPSKARNCRIAIRSKRRSTPKERSKTELAVASATCLATRAGQPEASTYPSGYEPSPQPWRTSTCGCLRY